MARTDMMDVDDAINALQIVFGEMITCEPDKWRQLCDRFHSETGGWPTDTLEVARWVLGLEPRGLGADACARIAAYLKRTGFRNVEEALDAGDEWGVATAISGGPAGNA
jgi:hypothetical protein